MRGAVGVPYWIFVGALTMVGIYASVFGNLPPYFLLIALAMAVLGAWWPGPRYSWAALVGFGVLPALFLSSSLLGQVVEADWSCSEISFRPGETVGYGGGPFEEEVVCATIPGLLVVATVLFWAITLFGAVVLYLLLRSPHRADARETWLGVISGPIGLGLILVVAVSGMALSVVKAMAPPPEAPTAPRISCPEYLGEEIGVFQGPGDQTTPAFETSGDGWGYEFASSGPGSLRITVLDGDGNVVESPDELLPNGEEALLGGEGVGDTEFAFSGTFSLEIDADDDMDYTVLVCD